MSNRLALEKSPYLLQHAENPVDWFPWGEEAFEKARAEDKPILLSIGYSTCHWCHVMERESFEDGNTAREMNARLVCIKVDREERPDIDTLYMNAVSAMTGQGGWPLNVFLTPELLPFYGGTYFPPQPSYGRPSFIQVVVAIAKAWREPHSREQILSDSSKIRGALEALGKPESRQGDLKEETVEKAYEDLKRSYDARHGGFGRAPKFPMPVFFDFLLRYGHRHKDAAATEMVLQSLRAMSHGGIHDHLGGGFARYSTDERWHVPHFEKMLYDNAQLAVSYLEAFQVSGEDAFASVARGILEYVLRDMHSPEGAFYSAEDADSLDEEGAKTEGAFYVWRFAEVMELLGPELAKDFCQAYGVQEFGNVESDPHGEFYNKNVLYRETEASVPEPRLQQAREILFAARAKRPRPLRDEKVLCSWNAMMLGAFAKAWVLLDEARYLESAQRAEAFLWRELYDGKAQILYRRWAQGERRFEGSADDYAQLAAAEFQLFEATGDAAYYEKAKEMGELCQRYFYESESQSYFMSRVGQDPYLKFRFQDYQDNVEPGAASVQILNLLRLSGFSGEIRYRQTAEAALRRLVPVMEEHPRSAAKLLCALEMALAPSLHVIVLGSGEMRRELRKFWAPDRIFWSREEGGAALPPFAKDFKAIEGKATAYICVDLACQLPTTELEQARELLSKAS